MTPQAIDWPKITVGGRNFVLRFSYAAQYQLTRWGRTLGDATAVEIAAASAGTFRKDGSWRSEGFERAIDLADMLEPGDEEALVAGVLAAVKKAYPEVEVSARPAPGTEATNTPEKSSTTNSDSSISGPLAPQGTGSD